MLVFDQRITSMGYSPPPCPTGRGDPPEEGPGAGVRVSSCTLRTEMRRWDPGWVYGKAKGAKASLTKSHLHYIYHMSSRPN